jgi:hypothetical protein
VALVDLAGEIAEDELEEIAAAWMTLRVGLSVHTMQAQAVKVKISPVRLDHRGDAGAEPVVGGCRGPRTPGRRDAPRSPAPPRPG